MAPIHCVHFTYTVLLLHHQPVASRDALHSFAELNSSLLGLKQKRVFPQEKKQPSALVYLSFIELLLI